MLKWISKQMNKKGFTLIELVIVIVILGLLTAVAIHRLSENAAISSHNSNVRILEGAANTFLTEAGVTADDVEWTGTAGEGWEAYLQSWPNPVKGTQNGAADGVAYTVTILGSGEEATPNATAGLIVVEPGKFAEDGSFLTANPDTGLYEAP